MKSNPILLMCTACLLLLGGMGCSLIYRASGEIPTPISEEIPAPTTIATQPAPPPTVLPPTEPPPTAEIAPADTAPPPAATTAPFECTEEVCILTDVFPLQRPIDAEHREQIDVSYRFGSSDHGRRDIHHGVEFLNPRGTPVLAAADGEVVLAGDDKRDMYGLYKNFYGNLVVLQHDFPAYDEPVFTLYGHLSEIEVEEGDFVEAGEKIGEVGGTGAATGSHLHFEVRMGENQYMLARNPELWLVPLVEDGEQNGVIAGRILDKKGRLVKIPNIVIERLTGPGMPAQDTFYVNTYDERRLVGLDPWQESFAIGELPPGEYQISFVRGGMQQREVEVLPGQLTLVTIQLDE